MLDLVLSGGEVVDGLGGPPVAADVGVAGDRVVAVGDLAGEAAGLRIDVTGRTVIPGIVDLHSHSDLTLLSDGRARSKVRQGVTTELVGNCGLGPFPLTDRTAQVVREGVAFIDMDPAVAWDWRDLTGFAAALAAARPALNVAVLVGHVPLRILAAPDNTSTLTQGELDRLLAALDVALEQGAVGFSTGLMYPPAMSADRAELVAIGRVVARHDRLFAIHARNYSDHLVPAVEEALSVAEETGCRLQFSHLAVAGRRNWGAVARALELVDRARSRGVDVGVDIYPYLAGSANLSQLLPGWAQEGGVDGIVDRLTDPATRRRILAELPEVMVHGWDEIEVSDTTPTVPDVLGETVEAIGHAWGVHPAEAALDLILQTRNNVSMVAYGRSEQDLDAVLAHPAASIGSDGLALDPDGPTGAGRPHPRSYGTYPRLLGPFVRDGRLTFERAVQMSTSLPAARIGLADRGRVAVGAAADLAVVDRAGLVDTATYTAPAAFPRGVGHVVVAGQVVVRDGEQDDGVRPGRVLVASATADAL